MKKLFLFLFAATLLLAGCTKENSSDSGTVVPGGSGNSGGGNSGGGGSDNSIAQNVKNHVTATSSVDRTCYRFIINVSSSLESVYPNKSIKYRVEFGYGYPDDEPYYWYIEESHAPACFCLRWCYPPGQELMQAEKDYLSERGISWDDYCDISFYSQTFYYYQDKIDNGETLTASEQAMLEEAAELMEEKGVNDLRYLLCARVCVEVDGAVYVVGNVSSY